MAIAPQYAAKPVVGAGALSAANPARTGTGTLVTLVTAGANGSRIDRLICQATATTTAGMLRFFLHNGTTPFLVIEQPVAALTPSATVASWGTVIELAGGLSIPSGWSLRASTEKAEAFHVVAIGGDY